MPKRFALRLKFHDEAQPRWVYEPTHDSVGTRSRLSLSHTYVYRESAERALARIGKPWSGTYDGPSVVEVDVTDLLVEQRAALIEQLRNIETELGAPLVMHKEVLDILTVASDNDADLEHERLGKRVFRKITQNGHA